MENQTTTTRTALKWGVIIGVITVLYSTAIMVSGQLGNQILGLVGPLITGIGIYLAINDFKKENQGYVSYGQGLGLGVLTSAIAGMISSLFSLVYMKFIDPSIMQQMTSKATQNMEKQGLSDDQIDQAMEYTKIFMNPGVLFVTSLIGAIFIGFILSLIIAAILKKEKSVFE